MPNIAITIIALLLFLAGIVWLQIFLSNSKNKWLGLIIPIICFMFSLIMIFSMQVYTNKGISTVTSTNNGVTVTNKLTAAQQEKPGIISILATIIPVFLISNIPTIIFLAIYFACRERIKQKKELDKMNVQDLE